MAGIGFRLRKLLDGDDLTSSIKAVGFSTLVTAGPFLLTILLILFVQAISSTRVSLRGLAYLQSLITYCFAFSLLTVGPSYLVLTRYVADEFYRGHVTSFTAAFFSAYTLNLLLWGPWVLFFFSGMAAGWGMKLMALSLYMLALGNWLAMIFLSAAQDYWTVSKSYLIGLGISLPVAYGLGHYHGLEGYFAGFVIGQGVVLAGLLVAMLEEFGYWEARDYNWLNYFKIHPRLALIGFFFNFGIWADKLLFWASNQGEWLDQRLRFSPTYDTPVFIAYMTILPALVYFFLIVETDFFFKYKAYYQAIQEQQGLSVLERRRKAIVASLRFSMTRILTIQGVVTLVAVLLAPSIVTAFKLDPLYLGVLRVAIFSSFLQAALLICMNVLLYFDHQSETLKVVGTFAICNIIFTVWSLGWGRPAFGYGFGLASLVALALALYYLNSRLLNLHFWTFTRQPFPEPVVVSDEEGAF